MNKYEIMLLVNGNLDEKDADKVANELIQALKVADVKLTKHGLKEMAYEIRKQNRAHYYQMNFESDDPEGLNEFRRLARINKAVLRQLVINLEKDYGYRATVNPKKIARDEKRAEVFVKQQEEMKQRNEERAAYYASLKEQKETE